MTPQDALKWIDDKMIPYYPLGVYKDAAGRGVSGWNSNRTKKTSAMQVLFAGFGGQGVLFAGKFLAYLGLIGERQVSWLPSYGPEMRGGTANCSVILSDVPIGSPIVSAPDCLIAMNLPSFQKYQRKVKSGGVIILDSS